MTDDVIAEEERTGGIRRPRLAPWHEYAVADDRLVIRHAERAVVFEGAAATRLLPALLDLLDGRRTVSEVVEALGPRVRPAIEAAVERLDGHGVLIDGTDLELEAASWRAAAAMAECSTGALPVHEVHAALAQAEVTVIGDGPVAGALVDLLAASGVSSRAARESDATAHLGTHRPDLTVVAPASANARVLSDVNRWSLEAGARWVQLLPNDGRCAVIGPLFIPGQTGCYQCFRLRRRAALDFGAEVRALDEASDRGATRAAGPWSSPGQVAALAGLAADLVARGLLPEDRAMAPLAATAYAVSWTMTGVDVKAHRLYRVPRCDACGRAADLGYPQPWFEAGTPQPEGEVRLHDPHGVSATCGCGDGECGP